MNVGIIVHSLTGHTYTLAEKLKEKLNEKGHSVTLEKINVVGKEDPQRRDFELDSPPKLASYDAVCFGAPVRGFSISPVLNAYLNQIEPLNGKKVACFVTKTLANNWTGGNRSIKQMKKLCDSKGGTVISTGILHWPKENADSKIDEAAENIASPF
ncbi:MAG: flavodoxin domain-containing protein [Eubacteriales bacterium]